MHRMQAYKTCDGKLFDSEVEAARHEATIKIHDWAKGRKIGEDGAITWETVADTMIEDAGELAYLFISLARALPSTGGPAEFDVLPFQSDQADWMLRKEG